MSKSFFSTDERMSVLSGQIGIIFLSLTQLALLGSILYRRYVLDQPEEYYNDLRVILAFSLFGFIATRLYLGAVNPVLSGRTLFTLYAGSVVSLFVILSAWFGLPSMDNWHNTILPVVLGPAILVGGLWAFSALGKRRLDKSMEED